MHEKLNMNIISQLADLLTSNNRNGSTPDIKDILDGYDYEYIEGELVRFIGPGGNKGTVMYDDITNNIIIWNGNYNTILKYDEESDSVLWIPVN